MAETSGGTDTPQIEIELKLLTDARSARRVWHQAATKALLSDPPRTSRIRTTYFDTPKDALMRSGCALRIRSCDGRFEQHLKTTGHVKGGLFHRQEWHAPLTSDTPDLSVWSGEAAAFIAPHGKTLQRIFESDMERTTAPLSNGVFKAELAVDIGVIRAFNADGSVLAETPLVEIELEWSAGPAEHLFDLAIDLTRSLPLRMGWQSKAERGYALVRGLTPQPRRAVWPKIAANCPRPQAMAQILGEAMAHFLTNQVCLNATGAAEAVHQTRVACRRMRAALTLFADDLPEDDLSTFRIGFRDLASTLGNVRDLDVLLDEGLAPLRSEPETPDSIAATLCTVIPTIEARRADCLAKARARMESPETTRLLLHLGQSLIIAARQDHASPIKPFADTVLGKRHHATKRRAQRLYEHTTLERHALRIAAKKLRYAAEFFQALYPRKSMHTYLRNLAALQDVLGDLNDISNLPRLISETAGENSATSMVAGYAMGWHLRRLRFSMEEATEICHALKAPPPFKRR
ncbi:MAG: CHAD domain-containing protein [Rhodospirillaceae bacterium]|nr:CHAD domain-containing protein [Rhodospirillaceae bacterium]